MSFVCEDRRHFFYYHVVRVVFININDNVYIYKVLL
nr:MAG TPA: hypothetical protein [Caudoviricetes sp.]